MNKRTFLKTILGTIAGLWAGKKAVPIQDRIERKLDSESMVRLPPRYRFDEKTRTYIRVADSVELYNPTGMDDFQKRWEEILKPGKYHG